ncbi:MAG: insulinase family protein [Pseudomonadota bacterium]
MPVSFRPMLTAALSAALMISPAAYSAEQSAIWFEHTDINLPANTTVSNLENGLRYIVLPTSRTSDELSIRVRIGADVNNGSAEPMLSQLIATNITASSQWQASIGSAQTVLSLDLAHADYAQLEQHLDHIKAALVQAPHSDDDSLQAEFAKLSAQPLNEAISEFHQRYYQPNNISVIVTGGVKSREVTRLIRRQFAHWDVSNSSSIHLANDTIPATDNNTQDMNDALALVTFKPLQSEIDSKQQRKDMLMAMLANRLIEQRIAHALEQQQSIATVQVKNHRLFQQQLMSQIRVSGLSPNERAEAQKLVREEIRRAAASGFTQAEYEMIVSQVRQELQRQTRLENQAYSSDQADRLVAAINQGIVYTDPSYDLELLNFHVAHLTEFDISKTFESMWSEDNIREL